MELVAANKLQTVLSKVHRIETDGTISRMFAFLENHICCGWFDQGVRFPILFILAGLIVGIVHIDIMQLVLQTTQDALNHL